MVNFRFYPKAWVFGTVLTFMICLGGLSKTVMADPSANKTFQLLDLFGEAFNKVRQLYVEDVADEVLIEAAIQGMLAKLDPHSAYLDAKSFQEMQTNSSGEFGGLGIQVTAEEGYVKVIAPIDDTPAARAGIESGDLIVEINNQSILNITLDEAVERMRGKVGTEITLKILRQDTEPFDVKIVRDIIRANSVRSELRDDIGYIRITNFTNKTKEDLDKALSQIKSIAETELIGYVLDLRNNPGGVLGAAIAVSDSFLTQGEIVSTRARDRQQGQRFYAKSGDVIAGKILVVLINGGSASASEIVAGALQDHRRAVILGTRSFGKGSVQAIFPLSTQDGGIKLTTQRYYTPSGRSIQAVGIEPDIVVERALMEIIEPRNLTSESRLPGALKNEDENTETPEEAEETLPQLVSDDDYQLIRAIELIRGIHLHAAHQN